MSLHRVLRQFSHRWGFWVPLHGALPRSHPFLIPGPPFDRFLRLCYREMLFANPSFAAVLHLVDSSSCSAGNVGVFECPCIACYQHRQSCSMLLDPSLRLYYRERLFAHHSFAPTRATPKGSSTAACGDGTLSLRGAGRAFAATFALSCCIFEAGCFFDACLHTATVRSHVVGLFSHARK